MARRASWVSGLILLLAVTASAQQPGGGRGGFRGQFPASGAMLLGIEEVRTELGTDSAQNTKIEELTEDYRARFRDLPQDAAERTAKMAEIAKETDAEVAKLLKPEQKTRLDQLVLQRDGAMAIARPEVAEKLSLTDEQKAKVKEILAASRPASGSTNFREMTDEQRREFMTQARERSEKANTELAALLTVDQKKTWEDLQGKKFTFPQRQGGRNRN